MLKAALPPALLAFVAASALPAPANPVENTTVRIAVSPTGDDTADGSPAHPFRTLPRAQAAVRRSNQEHDVRVELAAGVYRIAEPLRFSAADGGQAKEGQGTAHTVTWAAAPGARVVLSGGLPVTGWHLVDAGRHLYAASVPVGTETRQLFVDGHLAPMAQVELHRADFTFTRAGLLQKPGTRPVLPAGATTAELRATGFFTERIMPVESHTGDLFRMRQPAWDNNLWGYDTVEKPFHPELAHLYLANSFALLSAPGQWYLDGAAHRLYLLAAPGKDPNQQDVELPRLPVLVSIAGSPDAPVHDLRFEGIQFSYTSWLAPSGPEGYASQQSGTYLAGRTAAYPAEPLATCAEGCPEFETVRNQWRQMPAAVQVSAAERVRFTGDTFSHLGQVALGIGNDPDATLAGVGLGASDVAVNRCHFTDDAGGAILAGGVQPDAHHPADPRLLNQGIIVEDSTIDYVSLDYQDEAAILSTYVTGAALVHNDISNVPYDGIDIGFGWGYNDPGGNARYRRDMRGYEANPVYRTPTPHRDVIVASNRIHRAKLLFSDGGAIYNLSSSPGTLILENYLYDLGGKIGIYLDEGSRYLLVRRNVVDDPGGEWLNINTVHNALPLRISPDNTAEGNWHNSAKTGGLWNDYENDRILDDHLVTGEDWPAEAQSVMRNSGVEPVPAPQVKPGHSVTQPQP